MINARGLHDSILDSVLGRVSVSLSEVTNKSLTCTGKSSRLLSWLGSRWAYLQTCLTVRKTEPSELCAYIPTYRYVHTLQGSNFSFCFGIGSLAELHS